MRRSLRTWPSSLLVLLALLATSCATPPEKEIALARAALAVAETADADRLAPDEYWVAVDVLDQAAAAVEERDYRLALSRALDARERAEAATALATERQQLLRGEVEDMLAAIQAARAQTEARLEAAESGAAVAAARATVATIDELVQEARSALEREDGVTARDRLEGLVDRLRAVDANLEAGAIAASAATGVRS